MKNKFLELNGIDNINDYSFNWKISSPIEGSFDFENKKILGANISKTIISSKIINSCEEVNLDKLELFGNIFIVNILFDIYIEYCDNINYGKLNLFKKSFYKTFFGSLKDYEDDNIDIKVLTTDFDLIQNEQKLYYFIDTIIGISEM